MGVHVLLFLSQLFVRAPQITTLPSCIFFSPLEWFWSPPSVKCYIPLSLVFQALCSLVVHKQFSIFLRNSSQNVWAYFHIAKKWVNMITWHNCQYIISKYSMNIFLNIHIYMYIWGILRVSVVKNPPASQELQETQVWALGQKDPLEEDVATYSSIVAWRIQWIEGPGGLQSIGSQRIGHDWNNLACMQTHIYISNHVE